MRERQWYLGRECLAPPQKAMLLVWFAIRLVGLGVLADQGKGRGHGREPKVRFGVSITETRSQWCGR